MANSHTKKPAKSKKSEPQKRSWRRLSAEHRKQLVIEEATAFFAEHGFKGSTLQLAKRVGLTQPALYNHFSSKDELIASVYENAFPSAKYYPKWKMLLDDESIPIRERLIEFYCEYAHELLNYNFLRLSLWARLDHERFDTKYFEFLMNELFPRIIYGLKASTGDTRRIKPTAAEIEMVQTLHGSIYYLAIRRWIENRVQDDDGRAYITIIIDVCLQGLPGLLKSNAP